MYSYFHCTVACSSQSFKMGFSCQRLRCSPCTALTTHPNRELKSYQHLVSKCQHPQASMAQFSINSNNEPHFICKTHGNPMYLNYTLGSTLSRASISTLLFHARQKVPTRIDQDPRNGRSRIRETLPGRFWQYRADLLIYANDLNSRPRDLTWNELLQAIDLVGYCGVDKGIYVWKRWLRFSCVMLKWRS